jgi:hypothetical protein
MREVERRRDDKTSLNVGLDKVQEALVLALMIVLFLVIFRSDIELLYKVVVSVFVFSIIFLVATANQVVKQKENTHL